MTPITSTRCSLVVWKLQLNTVLIIPFCARWHPFWLANTRTSDVVAKQRWTRSSVTAEIAHICGHYAFQSYSRSLILMLIENQHATSCQCIIQTYSFTVFQFPRSSGQIIAFQERVRSFSVNSSNATNHILPKNYSYILWTTFSANSMSLLSDNPYRIR